ncbi:HIT domain-containing protein [Micrococcus sp.]|uniref:HIT family protein n=1 Tax=Micrococcus sp. TaxID=1271 RepID=UPI002A9140FB|nr:HIT domain-containing protein [Micrococcus sp.]MDY6054788.1 HIT domain-containing protein [Micrococcus sp.]
MTEARTSGGVAPHGDPAGDAAATDDFALPGVPDAFDRLWNPHRMAYIAAGPDQVKDEQTCPFCAAPSRTDEESLIVHRGRTCFVILNLYPYNPGHLLICPYRHIPMYTDATAEETVEMAELAQTAMLALEQVSRPKGYNLGMNQGVAGGAGIAAHLHQHVVPRWTGDGNFLPIIAHTKNMSQTLGQTRALLAEAWEAAAAEHDARRARNGQDAASAPAAGQRPGPSAGHRA